MLFLFYYSQKSKCNLTHEQNFNKKEKNRFYTFPFSDLKKGAAKLERFKIVTIYTVHRYIKRGTILLFLYRNKVV